MDWLGGDDKKVKVSSAEKHLWTHKTSNIETDGPKQQTSTQFQENLHTIIEKSFHPAEGCETET